MIAARDLQRPGIIISSMSKLIYITNTSLDGFIEDANGSIGWANPDEIHDWRWIGTAALEAAMARPEAARFTPWFRLEWERIWRDHRADVLALR